MSGERADAEGMEEGALMAECPIMGSLPVRVAPLDTHFGALIVINRS